MSYTESILTEDFVNKFNECLIPGATKLGYSISGYKSDIDQDSVFTEEIETKIRNVGDGYKYSNRKRNSSDFDIVPDNRIKPLEFDDKDAFNVERKYQEIIKKRRNKNASNNNPSTQQFTSHSLQYPGHYKHPDDQSTIYEDYSLEIRHKKNEIQMDIERERLRNRSTSPGIRRNNFIDSLSPRETLEKKVVELDQLTSSVKKATLEHQQLCKELREMENQLRRNQAEVRLSERMSFDNKEKIEAVNKELKAAERRRDQTVRNLDLVNEELALKRAKLRSFDVQMAREIENIRKMDHQGIEREEIEKILAERDELYQVIKRQEDAQFQKYELAKQLDTIRDDLYLEREKASRQIENLEDELECSLRKIKQLQFEKDESDAQLDHLRRHLCQAEDQACKSAREVSELKDEYHIKIKKKLDEYEMDKERVEKELKKLEDEKSLDEANLKRHIENIKSELAVTEKERKELRKMVVELEEHLRQATQSRNQILEEHEFKIKQLQNDKEEALLKQKKEFMNDQNLLIEEQNIQHRNERNKIQKQCNKEIDVMMNDLQSKDKEISVLHERIREMECEASCQLEKEKSKFENILRNERDNWFETSNKKKMNEINKIQSDFDAANKTLTNHVQQLTASLKDRDSEISVLKQEVCHLRLENQKIINENIVATRKIKDNVKQDTMKELKTRYEEKMDKELLKIKSECDRKMNSKISSILKEKTAIEEAEKRNQKLLCKIVKTVVHEINGECFKMASVLNVHPRKVDHSKLSEDFSKSDNIITQAIANLEACGSEIRNLLEELEMKVKSLTERIAIDESKMEEEIRNIKFELNTEKQRDIAEIRENLLKEHIKEINRLAKSPDVGLESLLREKEKEISRLIANRQLWKEKAAEKLAEKFSQLNKKKINELRNLLLKKESENRQLKAIRGRSCSPIRQDKRMSSALALEKRNPRLDLLPSEVISSLQENLEILRKENLELRHKMSGSEFCERKSKIENETRNPSKPRER